MYHLRNLESAAKDLERLDQPVARRIVKRIRWLAANLDNIKPEALKGDLADLYKLRSGDYRILYEILHQEKTIVVHLIGHRKEVYARG